MTPLGRPETPWPPGKKCWLNSQVSPTNLQVNDAVRGNPDSLLIVPDSNPLCDVLEKYELGKCVGGMEWSGNAGSSYTRDTDA